MNTYEVWEIINGNSDYKYNRDSYKFYTEQKSLNDAMQRVIEIFKEKYDTTINYENVNNGVVKFSAFIDGSLKNYELFALS